MATSSSRQLERVHRGRRLQCVLLVVGMVSTVLYLASKWTFWEVVWWRPSYSLTYRNGYFHLGTPPAGTVTQFKFESDGQLWKTGFPASMSDSLPADCLSGFAFARYADWSTPDSLFGGYLPRIRTSRVYVCVPMGSLVVGSWIGLAGVSLWRRRRVAALKGCCAACGYRRDGLPVGAVCPECGAAVATG